MSKKKNLDQSSSTNSPKRARTDLTLDQKREIILYNNSLENKE